MVERVYHPYWMWEETNSNMWGQRPVDRETLLDRAIQFMGDHKQYGKAMLRVIEEWKYSCEHNLTNLTQNREAWIGHAACALEFDCPENIVREAWSHLTQVQQDDANLQAQKAIELWGRRYTAHTINYELPLCQK